MHHQRKPFGGELRRLRMQAGWTLAQLAAAVHYSKGQLSKVERGLKKPSRELGSLCDAALSAKGALNALLADPPDAEQGQPAPAADEAEVWTLELSPDGAQSFQALSRRQLMGAGPATAFALRSGPATANPLEAGAVLASADTLLDHYRTLGQAVGPHLLLPVLIT